MHYMMDGKNDYAHSCRSGCWWLMQKARLSHLELRYLRHTATLKGFARCQTESRMS